MIGHQATFHHVAPAGISDVFPKHSGRSEKKPWDYQVTVAIPHLDTIEPLRALVELLRLQTERPYLMVIDTGSPPEVREELEAMRSDDLEVHFIAGHAYRHGCEPVCVALDLAQALCRTKHLCHIHADAFPMRRDLLEFLAQVTTANTPAIGNRMSPRDWITSDWEWMVGHVILMLYMPSIHRSGATWSFQRMHYATQTPWYVGKGWPDTEVGFNHALRNAGIKPAFIGHDTNFERRTDGNIDHVRSFPGAKQYSREHFELASGWMRDAIREAWERACEWKSGGTRSEAVPSFIS